MKYTPPTVTGRLSKFFFATFAMLLVTSSCGQPRPEVKAPSSNAVPIMASNIKVDKSAPKIMYINTNNVRIYDLTPALLESGVTSNTSYLEQFMKYDKVTLYDTRGDWAYVEGSARDTRTSVVRPVGGWVPQSTVTKWIPEKFFAVQDNVFKNIVHTITVYNDSLEGQAVDTISKGDTLRVLKGNGERFFVVSQQGKEGWIEAESVDTSQLVAKGVGYKEVISTSLPKSVNYTNYTGKPLAFEIFPEDLVRKEIGLAPEKNIPYFGVYKYKDNYSIQKNLILKSEDKEINLTQELNLSSPDSKYNTTLIEGKKYASISKLINNFFGMIAEIVIYIPVQYKTSILGQSQSTSGKFLEKIENELKQDNHEEIVRISLYSRNNKLKKIKEITLKGKFLFEATLENAFPIQNNSLSFQIPPHQVQMTDKGIKYTLFLISNNFLLDPLLAISDTDNTSYQKYKYTYAPVSFEIENDEIKLTGMTKQDFFENSTFQITLYQDSLQKQNMGIRGSSFSEIKSLIKTKKNIVIGGKNYIYGPDIDLFYASSYYINDINVYIVTGILPKEKKSCFIIMNSEGKILDTNVYDINNHKMVSFVKNNFIVLLPNIYNEDKEATLFTGVLYDY